MATCTMFAGYYAANCSSRISAADPDLANNEAGKAPDPAKLEKLDDNLKRFEENFTRHLKILLDALNYLAATETVVFLGLCARLSMANEGTVNVGSTKAHG